MLATRCLFSGHFSRAYQESDDDGSKAELGEHLEEGCEANEGKAHDPGRDHSGKRRLRTDWVVHGGAGEGAGDGVAGGDAPEGIGEAESE